MKRENEDFLSEDYRYKFKKFIISMKRWATYLTLQKLLEAALLMQNLLTALYIN